jgi:hypothetical protein
MRLYMLKKWDFLLVILALSVPLFAQTEDPANVSEGNFSDINVYIAPATGGTPEERQYFDFNLQQEVIGGGYQLTNSLYSTPAEAQSKSDFYITVELEFDAEYEEHIVTLVLYETRSGNLLVTSGMGYYSLDEMNEWNLTMIYRVMANAPIQKNITMEEKGYYQGAQPAQVPRLVVPQYWLYLGFRGGYSGRTYVKPSGIKLYIEEKTVGSSFEAGVQASFQPLRFLAIQAEALFTIDNAPFRAYIQPEANKNFNLVNHEFQSFSLTIPLVLKGTFRPSRFLIAPLAGAYFILPMGTMTIPSESGTDTSDYIYAPIPIGLTAGIQLGMKLGPGNVFVDTRYAADLGDTQLANGNSVYRRSMVSVGLGYEWGFIQRKSDDTADVKGLVSSGNRMGAENALNALPPIDVEGRNIKFDFDRNVWYGRVNGKNYLAGTFIQEGNTLTLTQSHAYSDKQRFLGGDVGWEKKIGPKIVLNYTESPASLSVARQ